MTEIEEMYENCNYRFKGKSCEDCPLKCKGKECELQRLKKENEEIRKINNDLAETHKTIGQDLYKECVSLRSELTVQKEVAKAFCRGLEQTEKLLGKYKQALEKVLKILCNGRTFYEGYFDTPILSRTDGAIKVINEVLEDNEDDTTINK